MYRSEGRINGVCRRFRGEFASNARLGIKMVDNATRTKDFGGAQRRRESVAAAYRLVRNRVPPGCNRIAPRLHAP